MQSIDQNIRWYEENFEQFEQSLNGEKSTWLHELRRAAISKFTETGFPTTRQEEWRFTNITPIAKINFQPMLHYDRSGLTYNDIMPFTFDNSIRLVCIDGFFSSELSDLRLLPEGLVLGSLAAALKSNPELVQNYINKYIKLGESPFAALNTAFILDGAYVSIPKNIKVELPIQLLFISTNRKSAVLSQPRNLIIIGENARASFIETYCSYNENDNLTNVVTEIEAGEGAVVEHNKLQRESNDAFQMNTTHVHQRTGSRYTSNTFVLGGSIVRNNLTSLLDGESIECTLNGLSLGTGTQLIDNHTVIDHARPNCNSHELYKSILGGKSKGIFNGKIFVRKDAQKTDAKQTNKTLLLSDDSTMNTKPQLEIFADDVKCTHGATVGQLDEEQVFYLRSRGIDEAGARDILTFAFAADIIDRITVPQLHDSLGATFNERLNLNRIMD